MTPQAPHFPPHFQTSAPMMENGSCTWAQLVWMGTSWARHARFYLGLMSFRKLLMDVDTPPAIIFHLSGPAGLFGSSATSWLSSTAPSFCRGGGGWRGAGVEQRRDFYPAVFKQQKKPLQSLSVFDRACRGACEADVFCFSIETTAEEDSIVTLCLLRHTPLSKNMPAVDSDGWFWRHSTLGNRPSGVVRDDATHPACQRWKTEESRRFHTGGRGSSPNTLAGAVQTADLTCHVQINVGEMQSSDCSKATHSHLFYEIPRQTAARRSHPSLQSDMEWYRKNEKWSNQRNKELLWKIIIFSIGWYLWFAKGLNFFPLWLPLKCFLVFFTPPINLTLSYQAVFLFWERNWEIFYCTSQSWTY